MHVSVVICVTFQILCVMKYSRRPLWKTDQAYCAPQKNFDVWVWDVWEYIVSLFNLKLRMASDS